MSWLDFWDSDNSIYVNRRHLDAHYRRLLGDLTPLLPPAPFTLLDFGCGEALMAGALAEQGGRILLHDAAPSRCAKLRNRYEGRADIAVVEDLSTLADGECDVIVMVSVAQYIPKEALPAVLGGLKRLLKPGGRLIVADLIPPDGSLVKDVLAFLGFAAANGFLLAALAGLVRTFVSDYGRLRKQLGLSNYTPDELTALLPEWRVERLARNVGFDQGRWTARLTPA